MRAGDNVWWWAGERGEPIHKERGTVLQVAGVMARVLLYARHVNSKRSSTINLEVRRLFKETE